MRLKKPNHAKAILASRPGGKQGGWRADVSPNDRLALIQKIVDVLRTTPDSASASHDLTTDSELSKMHILGTRLEESAWLHSRSRGEYNRKITRSVHSIKTKGRPPAALTSDSAADRGHVVEVKPEDADEWRLRICPEILCVNCRTGELDVTREFFDSVWRDHRDDPTWRCWVYVTEPDGSVMGVVIIQEFVHESQYFRWGQPLDGRASTPDPKTGAFSDIVEISFLCAKGAGSVLLKHTLQYIREQTQYKWVVLNSTAGAEGFYKKWGFKDVKAFRLPEPKPRRRTTDTHLYRHRIADAELDPSTEPPSIMLYLPVQR